MSDNIDNDPGYMVGKDDVATVKTWLTDLHNHYSVSTLATQCIASNDLSANDADAHKEWHKVKMIADRNISVCHRMIVNTVSPPSVWPHLVRSEVELGELTRPLVNTVYFGWVDVPEGMAPYGEMSLHT